jgi:hypothetical protein
MLSFHNVCPICNSELIHTSHIAQKCLPLDRSSFSYMKWKCNKDHFTQITDLYKNLLVETVHFGDIITEVNYVKHRTIIYHGIKDHLIMNRLLNLDYPKLIKAHNKVKTFLLFS